VPTPSCRQTTALVQILRFRVKVVADPVGSEWLRFVEG
jgi:hypothetical protein